jgi:hypothetical protein
MPKKIRDLFFQVGLVLASVVLSKWLDFPTGYVVAAILAIGFIVQWILQREEGEAEAEAEGELAGLFGGSIPWAELKPFVPKPKIDWGWSFPAVSYDANHGVLRHSQPNL